MVIGRVHISSNTRSAEGDACSSGADTGGRLTVAGEWMAVELAAVVGAGRVDEALGLAAIAGRFADGDLASICDHLAGAGAATGVVIVDENHSVQPGTSGWE